jgi:hypothetical protein
VGGEALSSTMLPLQVEQALSPNALFLRERVKVREAPRQYLCDKWSVLHRPLVLSRTTPEFETKETVAMLPPYRHCQTPPPRYLTRPQILLREFLPSRMAMA